ncbi:MAG TPA: DUF2255 family protein [Methylomirabilota bacterium]|jgi:hypothetical protein|nr:DUF2255 family protein [Methylomirabilota bacterium]
MTSWFERFDLDLLRAEEEIEIETRPNDDGTTHRTIIWVVVDEQDRVLIRSYRGPGARWFREVVAQPDCRIHIAGRILDARAVPATDPDSVAACSEGLRTKYAGHSATPSMRRSYLETTLELVPR